ncbi:hypothetical protein CPB84DRAFT_1219402 [Gymnopilus junonius]|uniref:SMODS and SLOG-associating 2TM effector domain-containing protein n=1 Tax=Gymnopilus junonius TaxID=109634 RepID=A0A9P5TT82_GYMJU|nr:hypothetical protein CPB84DRAFT_1219402 [Gymnopilus junonius]
MAKSKAHSKVRRARFKCAIRVGVGFRLQPTINHATTERDKYALKAKWTGWILNAAIGLQVLLGSLTTGLSAVATTGRSVRYLLCATYCTCVHTIDIFLLFQAAVNTTILGALSTIVASYLARARGSNEPELSIARTKDLDQFIRDCEAFKLDNGSDMTGKYDEELIAKRRRFEELLGNANGERKLAPPV